MASLAPVAPSMIGSNSTGVKKIPKVRSTCTMYFTSRKNRLPQLRSNAAAAVTTNSVSASTGTQRRPEAEPIPNATNATVRATAPTALSKAWASMTASGSTSRGK